jgi:hypothetical protein
LYLIQYCQDTSYDYFLPSFFILLQFCFSNSTIHHNDNIQDNSEDNIDDDINDNINDIEVEVEDGDGDEIGDGMVWMACSFQANLMYESVLSMTKQLKYISCIQKMI